MFIIVVYDTNAMAKSEKIYANSKAMAEKKIKLLSNKILENETIVCYDTNIYKEEEIFEKIPQEYLGRIGKASKCKKCENFFISNISHRYWCDKCYNEVHKKVECIICGKQFIQGYQEEKCCSKKCAAKFRGNFKNPTILQKIADTNKKKYGCGNPFNNPEIQKKCNENNDRKNQSLKLKEINKLKYKETRRLKQLKSNSRQISHKEMVLLDTLNKKYTIYTQHTFDDCVFKSKMRFDIFRPKQEVVNNKKSFVVDDLIIEYDGEQHYYPVRFNNISDSQMYKNFISTQVKDWVKDKYCIEKNIPLIRIAPNNKTNPSFEEIYKNASIIGKSQMSDKIFKCFGIIVEDFVNHKDGTFTIESGISCTFKCDKENGNQVCQNFALTKQEPIITSVDRLIDIYSSQNLVHSITFQGLEPLDNLKQLLWFIYYFRQKYNDCIYIWTGYTKDECKDLIYLIKEKMKWNNIIIKFGRFVPNQKPHYDEVLGIKLASDNQYAVRIC